MDVIGSCSYPTSAWSRVVRLLEQGLVDLEPIVTHRFPIARFEEAFAVLDERRGARREGPARAPRRALAAAGARGSRRGRRASGIQSYDNHIAGHLGRTVLGSPRFRRRSNKGGSQLELGRPRRLETPPMDDDGAARARARPSSDTASARASALPRSRCPRRSWQLRRWARSQTRSQPRVSPKSHPKWKFNFVNHVTTNPFFVPTIYGAQDACSVLGSFVPVDGLDHVRHQPDGQRDERRDHGQGGRHRGLPRRR